MTNLVEELSKLGTPSSQQRGEHVFRQGDGDRSIYVVKSGLLKAYYLTMDGKEQVKSLIQPGGFIGSMTACHSEETCSFGLICLQDSELLKLEFSKLREIARTNLEMSNFIIDGLLDLAMKKERREYEFLCLAPESRYQLIKERNPELLDKVTQNDIARYLGITPVALSRIKKRMN